MTTAETIADIIIARGVNTTYSYTIPDELIDQVTIGTPVMEHPARRIENCLQGSAARLLQ